MASLLFEDELRHLTQWSGRQAFLFADELSEDFFNWLGYLWDLGRRRRTMMRVATIAIAAANWVLVIRSPMFIMLVNIAQYG